MEIELERFEAVAADGETHVIVLYQEQIPAGDVNNPNRQLPGLKRYATSYGDPVNQIDAETFQVVSTNQIVRKR